MSKNNPNKMDTIKEDKVVINDKQFTKIKREVTRKAFIRSRQAERDFEKGDFTEIDFFLKYSGQQALNYALEWTAYHGKLDLVKKCISRDADVHANNDVALQMACENGHLDIVIYLLEQGANINAISPLLRAIDGKHTHVVKYLLEYRSKNVCDIHADCEIALRTAVNNGQYDIVKLLIEHGADINILEQYVLKSAVDYGYYDIVKLLIESGIDVSAIPEAIECAKKNNHNNIVEYLESIKLPS